jgi:hypothetical protein
MQIHFSAYPPETPGQKVSGSHPEFDRTKGMFYGLFFDEHTVRSSLKLCCHFINSTVMLHTLQTLILQQ